VSTERVAVVTGAGSGIGRDVAVALARAGYRVALAGRRKDALSATAQLVAGAGGVALAVPTDVRSEESVRGLFEQTVAQWGRIDLLFNNAGSFGGGGPIEDVPFEHWNQAIGTNLTGSFLCAQAAFRVMKDQDPQGGRIINNGSLSAHVPRPFAVAYTASKHAITGLTKAISLEGRPYQIACGQIDIGNANTKMTARIAAGTPQADGSIKEEPTFDPQHAADAVAFMADLPLAANVQFLTITATTMPFIGRG